MIACRLSYGVLVCIHHQPKANAKVIDFVEEFCDQLRTWYNYFAEQNKKRLTLVYQLKVDIMPFVVMCGLPSSGKTTRCSQLKHFMEEKMGKTVHIVGDDTFEVKKNEVYAESKNEKEVRGNLKSAVQRAINKNDVIILDSLNYIKGYRYELYCVTKSAQTPHCVIHCDINPTQASEWNLQRSKEEQYTKEVLDGLVMRFESPENRNRWDSPLFVVLPDDELPCQQIYDALYDRKAPPPNKSTLSQLFLQLTFCTS